jgi:hypothetical protein
VKITANLGDKLTLVGAQLAPPHVSAAEPMVVTLFFQVVAPLEEDESVFVHLEDGTSGAQLINLDHAPTGGATSTWRVGEVHRDEFRIQLPQGTSAQSVWLWLGMWNPKNDQRLELKNPSQVRNDGRNRIGIGPIPAG